MIKVKDAPGLVWKKRRGANFEARWQCRSDILKRGFEPKSEHLWSGSGEPTEAEWNYISDRCRILQTDMLTFGRGDLPPPVTMYDGTLDSLLRNYKSDDDSAYKNLRYASRRNYDTVMGLIVRDHGHEKLAELSGRTFKRWHREWSEGGRITIGHSKIGMLRILFGFGATILEDADCTRLSGILGLMKFPMAEARSQVLTSEQATAIRTRAHEVGRHSIALAQAFQFECMLRQKDVIGEWVPMNEPGISDVTFKDRKWIRGIRWEEIDDNLILRHVTSKRNKKIEVDLKAAPMVMEELAFIGKRPATGPVVIYEKTSHPWVNNEFRYYWRQIATDAGVPKAVKNMDSRAGAISEATDAGAELEHVRHAATHSDIKMTQRYSRNAADKTASVQQKRVAHRNKGRNLAAATKAELDD